MNHPFQGEIPCEEGKDYVADTRQRIRDEAATLRSLTGWSEKTIAKTVPQRFR